MIPFLVLFCCDLLDAVKHKSLAGKPKAECLSRGQWWLILSEGSLSCFNTAHTLRVLATSWFEKGLQLFNSGILRKSTVKMLVLVLIPLKWMRDFQDVVMPIGEF